MGEAGKDRVQCRCIANRSKVAATAQHARPPEASVVGGVMLDLVHTGVMHTPTRPPTRPSTPHLSGSS